MPVRAPLGAGSGLPSARRESSTRAAARPSADDLRRKIRASGRRARAAPCGRGGRRREGLRCLCAGSARPPPRRRARRARAAVQVAGARCASLAAGTPAAMRARAARAAKAPGTRRAGLGGGFVDSARPRQRAVKSSRRVLDALGRPVVHKRGLCLPLVGAQATHEAGGRLCTNDAAVWRAVGKFGTAVAPCVHGGRAAATGGKHTRVCRRSRSASLIFRGQSLCTRTCRPQRITPPA